MKTFLLIVIIAFSYFFLFYL